MWPMMWTLSPSLSAWSSCSTNHFNWPAGSVLLISNQLHNRRGGGGKWGQRGEGGAGEKREWGNGKTEREKGEWERRYPNSLQLSWTVTGLLTSFHCWQSLSAVRWPSVPHELSHCRILHWNNGNEYIIHRDSYIICKRENHSKKTKTIVICVCYVCTRLCIKHFHGDIFMCVGVPLGLLTDSRVIEGRKEQKCVRQCFYTSLGSFEKCPCPPQMTHILTSKNLHAYLWYQWDSLGDGVVCGVPVRELAEPRVPLSTGICQEPRVPILTCYERWRKPAVGQGKLHCETSESLVEFLLVFTIILHSHQWRR